MTAKLTLTIDNEVIDSAKAYAHKNGKSLSDVVENYLKSIATPKKATETLSPEVMRLMGVIKLPADFDYKKALGDMLLKKHGNQ